MGNLELEFTKMQATGNDYIYIDCFHNTVDVDEIKPHIKFMCDRNFGIGSDGVIFIMPSDKAAAKMLMFNKDGSEAWMCGNGIRSVARYLYDTRLVQNKEFTIETKSGIKNIAISLENGEVSNISVNMGYPSFNPHTVPVITEKSFFLNEDIIVDKETFKTTCVSMGNPHAVVFTKYINSLKLQKIGPSFECHRLFPERTNVEFVEKLNEKKVKMRIWERGTGETLSCGSGACASVAAGVMAGELRKNTPIEVIQKGGSLNVEYNDQEGIILSGPAEKVYEGKILIKKK